MPIFTVVGDIRLFVYNRILGKTSLKIVDSLILEISVHELLNRYVVSRLMLMSSMIISRVACKVVYEL